MIVINIKEKYLTVIDNISEQYHKLTQPSLGSTVTFGIVLAGIIGSALAINSYKVDVALANVEITKIQFQREKQELINVVKIERIRIHGEIEALKHQVKLAEIHAAANPYLLNDNHTSPVNVYIDTSSSTYMIETSDGATEIAVSMITINNIRYTPEQRKLMTMAFHIGQNVGYPETIQALLLQETRAGAFGDRIGDTNLPMGRRSYGVMQMKVATARKVLKKHKELVSKYFPKRKSLKKVRDEELIIRLIQDDEFNIRLAALNFDIHRKLSKSWAQAVVAYNTGQGAANKINFPKKHKYYNNILKRMISQVRPFNSETNLTL